MKAIHQRSRSAEKLHRPPAALQNNMSSRATANCRQNCNASNSTCKNIFSPTALLSSSEEAFLGNFKELKSHESKHKDALRKTTQMVAQTIQKLKKNDPLKNSGLLASQVPLVKQAQSTASGKRNLTPSGSRAKLLSRNPSTENYFGSSNNKKEPGNSICASQLSMKEQNFTSTGELSDFIKKVPRQGKPRQVNQGNIENCFSEDLHGIMANTLGRERVAEKINESSKHEERRNNRTPLKSINNKEEEKGDHNRSSGAGVVSSSVKKKEEQSTGKRIPLCANRLPQSTVNSSASSSNNHSSRNHTSLGTAQDSMICPNQIIMTPCNIQRALEDSFNDCSSLSIFESNRQQERRESNAGSLGMETCRQTKKPSIAEPLRKPSPSSSERRTPPESELKKFLPLEKNVYQDNLGNGPPTFNREYILNTGPSSTVLREDSSSQRKLHTDAPSKQSLEQSMKLSKLQDSTNQINDDPEKTANKSGLLDGTSNLLRGVCVQYPGLDDKDSIGKLISDLELSNREKEAEIFDLNLRLRDLQNEINQMKFRAGRQSRTPVKYSPNSKLECYYNEGHEELNFKRNKTPNPSDSALLFCEQMKEEISSIVNKSSFIANNPQSNMSFDYEKKALKSARVLNAKDLEIKNMLCYEVGYRESSDISSPINHEGKPHNISSDRDKRIAHTPAPFCPKSTPLSVPAAHVDTVQSMKGLLEELDKKRPIGGDSECPEEDLVEDTLVVEEEEDEFGESTPENFRKKGKNMRKILPKIVHSLKIDDTDCFQNELDIREFAIHHPLTKNPK